MKRNGDEMPTTTPNIVSPKEIAKFQELIRTLESKEQKKIMADFGSYMFKAGQQRGYAEGKQGVLKFLFNQARN